MGRRSTHEERPVPASPAIDVTQFPLSGDVTQENIDRLIAGVRHLKGKDNDADRAIVDKLRKELLSDTATARLTYTSGAKR
jgi:hypothetical protein